MGTKPLVAALLLLPLLIKGTVAAEVQKPLVVLELFTSEGCSSCPPADALLTDLAARPDVLPLGFHVTYWDRLGWKDPFSLEAATARQRTYAATLDQDTVYTPELVVDGRRGVVGSDRQAVATAIDAARHDEAIRFTLRLHAARAGVEVDVGAGAGTGTIWLVGFDRQHRTAVGRGENGGRTLLEANIVRSIRPIGRWAGTPLHLNAEPAVGEQVAALVQAPDGRIINAVRLQPNGS